MLTLQTVADLLQTPLQGDPHLLGLPVQAICTDSRQLQPGSVFVALRGERFDGHNFIPQALARGPLPSSASVRWLGPIFKSQIP
jgi:UDP-N-acetylmuramoyl-tripeptide--D-alanyl-D-alanine ligase (EC 6.3.2.10)